MLGRLHSRIRNLRVRLKEKKTRLNVNSDIEHNIIIYWKTVNFSLNLSANYAQDQKCYKKERCLGLPWKVTDYIIHSFNTSFHILSHDMSIASSKQVKHRGRSSVFSFKLQYLLVSLTSSSSCLSFQHFYPSFYLSFNSVF
jgi:hypothetical protein